MRTYDSYSRAINIDPLIRIKLNLKKRYAYFLKILFLVQKR